MATNTAGVDARILHEHAVHFMSKSVTFSDTGISTGVGFKNYLPSGARILRTTVRVVTAFDAATTNVLTVGQNGTTYTDFVNAGDVDETAAGAYIVYRGADVTISTDVRPFIKYTQTGTAATAGVAQVTIEYVYGDE